MIFLASFHHYNLQENCIENNHIYFLKGRVIKKKGAIFTNNQFMSKLTFHRIKSFNIPVSIGLTTLAHMLNG